MAALASYLECPFRYGVPRVILRSGGRGDYDRAVNVRTILKYGQFGLGDLISLDGNDGAVYPRHPAIVAQRRWRCIGNCRRVGGCGMNPARQRATVRLDSGKGALCKTLIRL